MQESNYLRQSLCRTIAGMKHKTPTLFPIEPVVPDPVRIELTEELLQSVAELLLQVLEDRETTKEGSHDNRTCTRDHS